MLRAPFLLLLMSGCFSLHTQRASAANIGETDKLVQQWISLEQQTAALIQDWQHTQPILQQRVQLLQAEKKQLQALLETKQQDAGSVEKKRTQLLKEQNRLEQDQNQTKQQLDLLLHALAALQPLLPPPLLQQWQREQTALAPNAETANQLQVALAQLSQWAEFDRRISVSESTLSTPQGQKILVKQLYLGAGRAWFASQDGGISGTGQTIEGRWRWQFHSDMPSQPILNAIAIFEKRRKADFIQLPLTLSMAPDTAHSGKPSQEAAQ